MKNFRIVLTTLLIVALILFVSGAVFATEADEPIFLNDSDIITSNSSNNNTTTNNTTNDIYSTATPTPTPTATATPTPTPTPVASNSSVYNNTNSSNLPKAGIAEDFSLVAIIIAFAAVALFAFKKIRDYKI